MTLNREITGKPAVIKEVNKGLIKDALSALGRATRVELSKKTGISQPTVNVLIKEMTEKKEILCLGIANSTGGRKAEIYTLNQKYHHIVSVIVRKCVLEYCIYDLQLEKEMQGQIPVKPEESYLEQLIAVLKKLIKKIPDIQAVSIGVPGAVSAEGKVYAIPQIPEWENFTLQSSLEEKCSLQVRIMNDINATAIGYQVTEMQNSSFPARNLVYLHVEENGLGAGIIIDGQLYPGYSSFAGEVGYMQIGEESLEQQLMDTAEEKRVEILSKVLINMICVLNPEKIVLGGNVSIFLAEQVKKQCAAYLPDSVIPVFTELPDSKEQYFRGLGQIGLCLLDRQIRLN